MTVHLSANAHQVLRARYLQDDETPEQRFRAVAAFVAQDDPTYAQRYYRLISSLDFVPSTPTLANAGRKNGLGGLHACYVLPIEDSLTTTRGDGILDIARATGLIHQTGGGTGFDFSKLRPAGDRVKTTNGVSSGPVAFIQLINDVTNAIKQGGIRRGANMAELRIDHPDIRQFIAAKTQEHQLTNFNISVSVTDEFMEQLLLGNADEWPVRFGGEIRTTDSVRGLWDFITESAWKYGDPGVVFIDQMNRDNPLRGRRIADKELGLIDGTVRASNPCSEVPLLAWEACTLGSINLANFLTASGVDNSRLREVVTLAARFLDDVVSVNRTPLPQIDRMTRLTRRIGLGVMGWADLLNKTQIPYDSEEAIALARDLGRLIRDAADETSAQLARERGAYPLSPDGEFRNIARLAIAPTGSISTIANCSAGIEPYFAREVIRKLAIGELREKYANADAPWFRTAMEIAPEWHVRMQAAWQRYVDNGVSKTVNLPNDATVDDVRRVYELAYTLGAKGVTIYRDGSRDLQVYNTVVDPTEHEHPTVHQEGCVSCPTCGWSACVT